MSLPRPERYSALSIRLRPYEVQKPSPSGSNPDTFDYRPLDSPWMDSVIQETLLPNAPWHPLQEVICEEFTGSISTALEKPEKRQMIFTLLGTPFVSKYFKDSPYDPSLLEPPKMSTEAFNRLESDAQMFLNNQWLKAARNSRCYIEPGGSYENTLSVHQNFMAETYEKCYDGLDLHLNGEMKGRSYKRGVSFHSDNPDKLSLDSRLVTRESSTLSLTKPTTQQCWGAESDVIGSSLRKLIERDPKRIEIVCKRLNGKPLPSTLRSYIWTEMLFKKERKRVGNINVEKIIRDRFGRAVGRGVIDLKIQRATKTPINGLIENAVIETYNRTPCMLLAANKKRLGECTKSLNILYAFNRSYEPYHIHWLYPLQLAFVASELEVEQPYNLCMFLNLLSANMMLTWPRVFLVAENVMERVKRADEQFYNHLNDVTARNIEILDTKDFLVQLISMEKGKAASLKSGKSSNHIGSGMSRQLLANPLIFIRKWIGESFVGVLDTAAVLFIWDQLFFNCWSEECLEDVCLALLFLMKPNFEDCVDYPGIKELFLYQPSQLYTQDIQIAYNHLRQGLPLRDVTSLNRYQDNSAASLKTKEKTRSAEERREQQVDSVIDAKDVGEMDPIGIKTPSLKLVFKSLPDELTPFDPEGLRLLYNIYYGNQRLRSLQSNTVSELREQVEDAEGNTVYSFSFYYEKQSFIDIDPRAYDGIKAGRDVPFLLVRILYTKSKERYVSAISSNSVTLGYAYIPITVSMTPDSDQVLSKHLHLPEGEIRKEIWAGSVPEFASSMVPVVPNDYQLQEGSSLSLISFALTADGVEENEQKYPKFVEAPSTIWTEHSDSALAPPDAVDNESPFDIYIDGIRWLPDNCAIAKVTAQLLRAGYETESILALPAIDSSGRSPDVRCKKTFNDDPGGPRKTSPEALLVLRIYMLETNFNELVVAGTGVLSVYNEPSDENENPNLNLGGYQVRLKHGQKDGSSLTIDSFEGSPASSGLSVLVRLLPHSEEYVPAPDYDSGFYWSESCRPGQSESRVLSSYHFSQTYPGVVRGAIEKLKNPEGVESQPVDGEEMEQFLISKLDDRGDGLASVNLWETIRYNISAGLLIEFDAVYGIDGKGKYTHIFARVNQGVTAHNQERDQYGGVSDFKFITSKHDYTCLETAPKWLDDPWEVHPIFDLNSCLILQIFAITVQYRPDPELAAPGTVEPIDGANYLEMLPENQIGWTAMNLFSFDAVNSGTHILPVFKSQPSSEFMTKIYQMSVKSAFEECLAAGTDNLIADNVCLKVNVWDGHFVTKQERFPMETNESLLAPENVAASRKVQFATEGTTMQTTVLNTMKKEFRVDGPTGERYDMAQRYYEQAMSKAYSDMMDGALMNAGFGPL